jgi:Zn-dependent protease with chaperone function
MDFFERQDKARRNTKLLIVYFIAGVSLLIVAIYVALLVAFTWAGARQHAGEVQALNWWNPQLFMGTTLGTLAVITIGSLFKTMQLSRGGSAVATMLGGRLLNPNTTEPDERKLLNVVEEMALASGVPVPQVYVMDQESGINAFAAGHSTSDAVVGVTRGCMKLLTRDELQGVIGHEFSHILNGDMRLNMRLMGLIFGIFCIAVIGRVLLHARGGRRDKNPLPLVGLIFLALGGIGVLFGRLIQAAVSRQREFLADAAAVQFTRNPSGLAGALKKIGGLAHGSKLEAPHASEASHLFFGNGMSAPLIGMMSTHPPLPERIRAIEPGFDGKFPKVSATAGREIEADRITGKSRPPAMPFPFGIPGMPQSGTGAGAMLPPVIAAAAVLPNLGEPTTLHLRYAEELRNSFSPPIQAAAHDTLGASVLIYGLLLSSDLELRKRQLDILASATSRMVRQETEQLLPEVGRIAIRAKLPVVDLALPALRQLSLSQYEQFTDAIRRLTDSDDQIDLFEYVLQKTVLRHLEPQFKPARKPVVQYYTLGPLASDCVVLLSALAHAGSDDATKVSAAFQQGASRLSQLAHVPFEVVPSADCGLAQVDAALKRLNEAAPQIKKNVIQACALTVAADGVIQEMEAELLRAIADALDCPIPPFVAP